MGEDVNLVKMYLHAVNIELTFAGLHALRPPVISVSVPTILIPSTARSATTDSAGFLERATLCADHLIGRGDDLCGRSAYWYAGWRADYF